MAIRQRCDLGFYGVLLNWIPAYWNWMYMLPGAWILTIYCFVAVLLPLWKLDRAAKEPHANR